MPKVNTAKKQEVDNGLSAVEKKFYELSIASLNKQLVELRERDKKLSDVNEELEGRMKQREEDKQDINAFLNRTLHQKAEIIEELQAKVAELSAKLIEDKNNFNKQLIECENKNNETMELLKMDIKLLQEPKALRLEREDLLAKLKVKEIELESQEQHHKTAFYEMERKFNRDTHQLQRNAEKELLNISNEFTRTNAVRIASATQRLLRENIALNNEMDRMMSSTKRIQREGDELKEKQRDAALNIELDIAEKKRLIKTCSQQLEVIKKLTVECENIRDENLALKGAQRLQERAVQTAKVDQDELQRLKKRIVNLQQHVRVLHGDRQSQKSDLIYWRQEYERVSRIVKSVLLTVKSVIKGETDNDDPAFREFQRENLLIDLLEILEAFKTPGNRQSLETIPSAEMSYVHDRLASAASGSTDLMIGGDLELGFLTPSICSVEVTETEAESESVNDLLDPVTASGSDLFDFDDDSIGDADNPVLVGKPAMDRTSEETATEVEKTSKTSLVDLDKQSDDQS